MVDNSGVIGGGTIGISTSTPSGVKTTIVNESGRNHQGIEYAIDPRRPGQASVSRITAR